MISPDTILHIYEIRGDVGRDIPSPPPTFIGLWNEEEIAYLFFTSPESQYIRDLVLSRGLILGSHNEMRYEDWQTGLPQQGIQIGGVRFVRADHPSPAEGSIRLDPSVVFGDGTHPTTLRCLRLLHQIVRNRTVNSVLDLGTGTGILALAAAALGVRNILAVDRNHLAVQTAQRNVELNELTATIRVTHGEARVFVDRPFDVVAANLPYQVLREVVTMRGVTFHRSWIVSGINSEQGEVLKGLLTEQGHRIVADYQDPPWVTFSTVNSSRQA